jgi:hypothetical protein
VKRRALVDSVLDWHHSNTRRGAGQGMRNTLLSTSHLWCKDGPFLCGAEEISIADVQLACEMSQLKVWPLRCFLWGDMVNCACSMYGHAMYACRSELGLLKKGTFRVFRIAS